MADRAKIIMKYYTLVFTEKELLALIDGIDSYSSAFNGVFDEEATKERQKAIKAFDKALAKIGLKREFN